MEQDEGKSPSLDDLEFMSDERVAYEQWAARHGHTSTKVRSTLVDYFVSQDLENDHDLHKKLAKEFGFEHDDIMADIKGKLAVDTDSSTEENARELSLAQVVEAISKI